MKEFEMTVRFVVADEAPGREPVSVFTDGSFMGTYPDFSTAGHELGDEFRHRMEIVDNP